VVTVELEPDDGVAPVFTVLSEEEALFEASVSLVVVLLAEDANSTSVGESTRLHRSVPQA